ncbi:MULTISPECIES: hypothetical protein [unclassified Mesorhizobium]|uniref:hypothetical protein n=1 Tax=unclassified Mesorhizobium TaxID=325217 RepID=UPI000FCA54EF|nr:MULTISPECIES: hypothetical protein [unclassified Mesorhizobium]RUV39771.1 hypothetical protein EOD29_30470 [Mesorhizobium sp. M1A.T.Ca.IN.004.03.1.1]RWK34577.1 MAG: hypothetical protein EOR40_18155 [Mesorhizobium sp.]RWK83952.1 MAG: hypothetical protein EOR52_29425 [Mesorhizobium sp.]TIP15257.1 MAG: hypothetical protein E5X66_30810 [Mesorhizobium sp.]TJV77389.1 MAG: hypothetical protein E5X45_28070 [Mesorhizobium sp.]
MKGTFAPAEVELLIRVFESGSVMNETEDQREHTASRIIAAYMAGISDEQELLELSRRPLGR